VVAASTRRRLAFAVLTLASLPLAAAPGNAQPGAGVQQQLDALNKRLDRLETLLQSLQARQPAPTTQSGTAQAGAQAALPAGTPPPLTAFRELATVQANWQRLRRGQSPDELLQLLGKPHTKLQLGRQTLWYYRYPGIGSGSVMLGNSGTVTGWQQPAFSRW